MTNTIRTFDVGYDLKMRALRGDLRAQAELQLKADRFGNSPSGQSLMNGAKKAEADFGRCSML